MSDQVFSVEQADLPIVTVIVVNHNYGCFLADCLRSIAAQSYASYECLVVDNASSDGSEGVFDLFRSALPPDRRGAFEWLGLAENKHQTAASIEAFRQAKGDFVIFVDADDFLLPHCLELHVETHLSLRVSLGFTCGDMIQIRDGRVVAPGASGLSRFVIARGRPDRGLARCLFRPANRRLVQGSVFHVGPSDTGCWPYSATSGFCYRKEAVALMFARPPDLASETDAYLAHGIAALIGGAVIDRPVAAYRYHGGNVFSQHPPLHGMCGYHKEKSLRSIERIAREIIACYLANASSLASRLLEKRRYFDAVQAISTMADGLLPQGRASTFMLDMLLQHLPTLRASFGDDFIDALAAELAGSGSDKRVVQHEYRRQLGQPNRRISFLPRWLTGGTLGRIRKRRA